MQLCSRCGFQVDPKHYLYSTYTRNWYCTDIDGCNRRESNDLTWAEIIQFSTQIEDQLSKPDFDNEMEARLPERGEELEAV